MADFFGASSTQKSVSLSINPVGGKVAPKVSGPISSVPGQTLGTQVMQIGSSGGMSGATAGKGGKGSSPNPKGQRPETISADPNYKWAPGNGG